MAKADDYSIKMFFIDKLTKLQSSKQIIGDISIITFDASILMFSKLSNLSN
jgi:hypothetical protein